MKNFWKNIPDSGVAWDLEGADIEMAMEFLKTQAEKVDENGDGIFLDSYISDMTEHLEQKFKDGYLESEDIMDLLSGLEYCQSKMGNKFPFNINCNLMTDEEGYNIVTLDITKKKQSLKQIYKKVKSKEAVVLKPRINFIENGKINHPLRDQLWMEAKNDISRYDSLLREKLLALETQFPEYEDFYYEFESDATGSWYNLMGTGV